MKLLTITLILSWPLALLGQDKIIGQYRDNFGRLIRLSEDNTFKYTWSLDKPFSWSKGTWSEKNDTIYFHMVPTYDTLSRVDHNGNLSDSLILSDNEIPERLTSIRSIVVALPIGMQNRVTYPDKLFFKGKRLYRIENGKVITKRQKVTAKRMNGSCLIREEEPWFSKIEE